MDALILVDIQNDFLPGGALEVPKGDEVVPVANELQQYFDLVVATQDYHPSDHGSFAIHYPGKKPGDVITLNGLEQILWPVHCVQGKNGSEFAPDLKMDRVTKIFPKGMDQGIDSYSGFFDNGHKKDTGLNDFLKEKGVDRVVIVGLAADVCVKFTVLDACKLGYETIVVTDGIRAVNLQEGDYEKALEEMKDAGAKIMSKDALLKEVVQV